MDNSQPYRTEGPYTCDIEKVTCNCADFYFRRRKFAKTDERKRCRHLKEAMVDIPTVAPKTWSEKRKHPRSIIEPIVNRIATILNSISTIEQFVFTGSYRRMKSDIGDIDIIVQKKNDNWDDNPYIIEKLKGIAEKTMISGAQKSSFLISGVQVDVRFIMKKNFVYQLLHSTGSKESNIKLRAIAKKKNLVLNEYGLFKNAAESPMLVQGINSEEDIYKALGLSFVSPDKR